MCHVEGNNEQTTRVINPSTNPTELRLLLEDFFEDQIPSLKKYHLNVTKRIVAIKKAQSSTGGFSSMTKFDYSSSAKFCNSDLCARCGNGGDLLLCDACPQAFHTACIGVTRNKLPKGEWICPDCLTLRKQGTTALAGPVVTDVDRCSMDSQSGFVLGRLLQLLEVFTSGAHFDVIMGWVECMDRSSLGMAVLMKKIARLISSSKLLSLVLHLEQGLCAMGLGLMGGRSTTTQFCERCREFRGLRTRCMHCFAKGVDSLGYDLNEFYLIPAVAPAAEDYPQKLAFRLCKTDWTKHSSVPVRVQELNFRDTGNLREWHELVVERAVDNFISFTQDDETSLLFGGDMLFLSFKLGIALTGAGNRTSAALVSKVDQATRALAKKWALRNTRLLGDVETAKLLDCAEAMHVLRKLGMDEVYVYVQYVWLCVLIHCCDHNYSF